MSNSNYLEALSNMHTALKDSYHYFLSKNIDYNSKENSVYILERMKAYYESQYRNKDLLEKRYITNGADFFTEQVLFFVKVYLARNHIGFNAYSEKQIQPRRGAIRPDISIWKDEEVVAIIECKTQLGWNRHAWESDFQRRENALLQLFPNATALLIVLTGENWGGFEGNELLGKKYFCLLANKWVTEYKDEEDIFIPIEQLFEKLIPKGLSSS